ncbi:MAG: 2,3-bisphosphoglycerate-dependent phosphoglycerate mutase [Patescibacteria group bacterium]
MAYLVLVRHGQSEWNVINKFTGHTDVELTEQGREEARKAAGLLSDIVLHKAHTSDLKRAQETLKIILAGTNQQHIEVKKHPAIKERDYGDLAGMNKDEAKKHFGAEKFQLYRRSWHIAPPNGESLKDTAERALPYFEQEIMKDVKAGHNVIVAAHGNSLRAIVKHLEEISDEDIPEVVLGTGVLYIYEIDDSGNVIRKEIRDHSKSS